MSRVSRLVALPRQLTGALRRNGVRNVWRFGAEMVAQHGLVQTLRHAIAPPDLRRARFAGEEGPPPLHSPPSDPAGDFDGVWGVAPELWGSRVAATRLPSAAVSRPDANVFVVYGADAAPPEADDADWIVLLQPGDAPSASLPSRIAVAGAPPFVQVVTFDMTFAGENGRVHPVLQPGANPWLAFLADVGFGRYAFRAGMLRAASGEPYARLRAWLAQRSLNEARDRWVHVFEPLADVAMDQRDIDAARREAISRAKAALAAAPMSSGERVSAVICTHNRGRLVRQLVRAIDDPRITEVVVVANNTTSPPALETLEWVRARPHCQVLVRDEPFNFSRLCNAAAAVTGGERLLFLNDDVVPISDDWLEPLLQPLRNTDVGVSGALLLYPNEAVQHAGMFLGFRGHAGHSLRHARLPEDDYLFYGSVPREVSAVTGAVMMVHRHLFEALNGFDELLPSYLQDVDLCLRARAIGAATVWSPLTELLHMESTTIRDIDGPAFQVQRTRERARFLARWSELIARDPLRNPAFDVDDEGQRTLAAT